MRNLKIAIIGAGTAGLAAASFLARSGHEVSIYERFNAPKPVGAGLLLQPTGLAVLSLLELDEEVREAGSRINQLYGKVCGRKAATLDVRYSSISPHLYGLGIHRASLFSALHHAAIQSRAEIIPTHEITALHTEVNGEYVVTAKGKKFGPYDLVVDCSGAKSALRAGRAKVKRDRAYPYGAIWSIVKNKKGSFAPDTLEQRYKHAYHMIGVLPVGRLAGETSDSLAFFWSMKTEDYPVWKSKKLKVWQDYVSSLWPEAEELVRQFETHDDLAFASYRDVVLKEFHHGNIVFIGDAAHCTSPQLGQGANLALLDAMVLANCINTGASVAAALQQYGEIRKNHIYFYQMASRILTPFFQSDSRVFAALRFLTCGLACKIPFTQKIAAQILSGTKTGMFTSMNPGLWAKDYDLFQPPLIAHNQAH